MKNAIFVIKPYKWNGMWVFDDERVYLDKEPFVAGADTHPVGLVPTNDPLEKRVAGPLHCPDRGERRLDFAAGLPQSIAGTSAPRERKVC